MYSNTPVYQKVLIIRLSSLGDVLMSVDLITLISRLYKEVEFDVLTNTDYHSLFQDNARVKCLPWSRQKQGGFLKTLSLAYQLKKKHYDVVIDLHDVLRSHIICTVLRNKNTRVFSIQKGRFEKTKLIKNHQLERPLIHTVERYLQVFNRAGFKVEKSTLDDFIVSKTCDVKKNIQEKKWAFDKMGLSLPCGNDIKFFIGIAPFAQHPQKIYPLQAMQEIIAYYTKQQVCVILFGKGQHELQIMQAWCQQFKYCVRVPDSFTLKQELELMRYLNVMLCMDSANMHLATLARIPVVPIFGPTHPFLGFYGYLQPLKNCVQVELSCRPCSSFGQKACVRGDLACMHLIKPDDVIDVINRLLAE